MAGIEIAPEGTRALLTLVALHLRDDEEAIRDQLKGVTQEDGTIVVPLVDVSNAINAEADRCARLAGRIDALLAGWEPGE